MDTTVTLNKRHFKAAADKARQLGKTPQGYIESLIDAAAITFEDILRPLHQTSGKAKVSEQALDDAIAEARKAINKPKNRKARK